MVKAFNLRLKQDNIESEKKSLHKSIESRIVDILDIAVAFYGIKVSKYVGPEG